jgi:beta-N-acetylhexosaminidase
VPADLAPPANTPDPVEALLAGMSLEAKIGQLFLVFFEGPELSPALREMIETYRVGGIVLFASTGNVVSPQQLATLINDVQRAAVDAGSVPLLVAVDQEGGTVARLQDGFTPLPGGMALGATGSPERARQVGGVIARELRAVGINMNLAPVLDVNSNPANPVIGLRSYGSSPDLVASLGLEVIRAHRDENVIATAKHFPGHGDTAVDSHFGLPVVPHDRSHLEAVELAPFRAAIADGVDAIMTAHVELPAVEPTEGLPATLSAAVLQGLLRQEMGFPGVIVTDSLGMGALMERYTLAEAALAALLAGADILAFGADAGHTPAEQKEVHAALVEACGAGVITPERLDESVRRILRLKARYGLLEWEPVALEGLAERVGTAEHRALVEAVAEEAITLVRDDADLVPLPSEGALLVIAPEPAADLIGAVQEHRPLAQGLVVAEDPSADEIAGAVAGAEGVAAVLVATRNAWQHPGQVELVRALAGRPLAVLAVGTPYDLLSFPDVWTYAASYGAGGPALRGAARVLCGVVPPRGKLPVDLPGLYPLGHGLAE